MDIVPITTRDSSVSTVDIEQVQQEEKEYVLLGTFLRTNGLKLFYYNPGDGSINEAKIKYSNTLHIYKGLDGKFFTVDWEAQKCTIDSKCIYFECLNMANAISRVKRFKKGIVKDLFNLRKPNPDGIKFF